MRVGASQPEEGHVVTVEMVDDIRVTVGEAEGEDGMKQCHRKAVAVGGCHQLNASLTQCTKINSKWFKDLNIRHDTIKLLQENIGKIFSDVNHTNVFRSVIPDSRNKNKTYTMTKWDSSQVNKDGSTYANQSMSHSTLTKEK